MYDNSKVRIYVKRFNIFLAVATLFTLRLEKYCYLGMQRATSRSILWMQ